VIVLMLENRSFDHALGGLQGTIPGLDGVAVPGARTNPGPGGRVAQEPVADPRFALDLPHEFEQVKKQAFTVPPMDGFVNEFALEHPGATATDQGQVMAYFSDGTLPALHALAKNFRVCNRWFSSMPGPTWPNRFFAHSGTSLGEVIMPNGLSTIFNFRIYYQDTLYDRLSDAGVSWRIYHDGIPQSAVLVSQWKYLYSRYSGMDEFFRDVKNEGRFPAYTFIEPRYFGSNQNDEHPPSDALRGDDLVARVYNAIRGNDALWKSSLLVVLYDEHGGFYDHALPPKNAEPPDDHQDDFDFTCYGVRVPAVLVSPWVEAKPDDAVYDHTSILKYAMNKWGVGDLGARAAAANPIASGLLSAPRADTPASIGRPSAARAAGARAAGPLQPHQRALLRFMRGVHLELAGTRAAMRLTPRGGEITPEQGLRHFQSIQRIVHGNPQRLKEIERERARRSAAGNPPRGGKRKLGLAAAVALARVAAKKRSPQRNR
jgi:hypothetical protein